MHYLQSYHIRISRFTQIIGECIVSYAIEVTIHGFSRIKSEDISIICSISITIQSLICIIWKHRHYRQRHHRPVLRFCLIQWRPIGIVSNPISIAICCFICIILNTSALSPTPSSSVSRVSESSFGAQSALSPMPSPSLSVVSLALFGKASALSPTPSWSKSAYSLSSFGKTSHYLRRHLHHYLQFHSHYLGMYRHISDAISIRISCSEASSGPIGIISNTILYYLTTQTDLKRKHRLGQPIRLHHYPSSQRHRLQWHYPMHMGIGQQHRYYHHRCLRFQWHHLEKHLNYLRRHHHRGRSIQTGCLKHVSSIDPILQTISIGPFSNPCGHLHPSLRHRCCRGWFRVRKSLIPKSSSNCTS